MKHILCFYVFSFFFIPLKLIGQDTLGIDNLYWVKLKAQLQHRNAMVKTLTAKLSKPVKINPKALENLKNSNFDFSKYLDGIKVINSETFAIASSKHNRLSSCIMTIFIEMEKNRNLIKKIKFIFQFQQF